VRFKSKSQITTHHLVGALARRNIAVHLLPELHFVRDEMGMDGAHDVLTITETVSGPTKFGALGPIAENVLLAAIWLCCSCERCFCFGRIACSRIAFSTLRQVWARCASKSGLDQDVPEPSLLARVAAFAANGPSAPIGHLAIDSCEQEDNGYYTTRWKGLANQYLRHPCSLQALESFSLVQLPPLNAFFRTFLIRYWLVGTHDPGHLDQVLHDETTQSIEPTKAIT
jgi:hypothetical protein